MMEMYTVSEQLSRAPSCFFFSEILEPHQINSLLSSDEQLAEVWIITTNSVDLAIFSRKMGFQVIL